MSLATKKALNMKAKRLQATRRKNARLAAELACLRVQSESVQAGLSDLYQKDEPAEWLIKLIVVCVVAWIALKVLLA